MVCFHFSEILIKIYTSSFKKMHFNIVIWKLAAILSRALSLNVLRENNNHYIIILPLNFLSLPLGTFYSTGALPEGTTLLMAWWPRASNIHKSQLTVKNFEIEPWQKFQSPSEQPQLWCHAQLTCIITRMTLLTCSSSFHGNRCRARHFCHGFMKKNLSRRRIRSSMWGVQ